MIKLQILQINLNESKCDAKNRIYNIESLSNLISENVLCKHCKSRVYVTETLHGIASSLILNCKNCGVVEVMEPLSDSLDRGQTKKGTDKMTKILNYAINKFAVVGTFFVEKQGRIQLNFFLFWTFHTSRDLRGSSMKYKKMYLMY